MKSSRLKELYNHPLLNKNALARKVFPDGKPLSVAAKLHQKMHGTQGKYLTEEEGERLIQALQNLASEISRYFPQTSNKMQYSEIEHPEIDGELSDVFPEFTSNAI